jgi:hypothetical protein
MSARSIARVAYWFAMVCAAVWIAMYGVACVTIYSREYAVAESRLRDASYTWDAVCVNPNVHVPSMGEEGRACERVRAVMDAVTPRNFALERVVAETHSCLLCSCTEVTTVLWLVLKIAAASLLGTVLAPTAVVRGVRRAMRAWDDRRWRRHPTNRMENGVAVPCDAEGSDTDTDLEETAGDTPVKKRRAVYGGGPFAWANHVVGVVLGVVQPLVKRGHVHED